MVKWWERKMGDSVSPVVRNLLKSWESKGVSYCHWKSTDHLAAAMSGETDLDILVSITDGSLAENIAAKCGFTELDTAVLRRYPGVKDFVAYDRSLDRFIHLHLHYQLVLGDRWVKVYRLPVENGVLKRRSYDDRMGTYVVSAADEFLLFCARMIVKFRRPFHRKRVQVESLYLLQRLGGIPEISGLNAAGADYPSAILALADAVKASAGSRIQQKLVREGRTAMRFYRRKSALAFRLLSGVRLAYRILVEWNRRKRGNFTFGRRRLMRGGLAVAFIGMDGSGKTSAISRNLRFFSRQLDVDSVFLGSGKSGAPWYRRLVLSLFGSKARLKGHKKAASGTLKSQRYPFYYLTWIWIVLFDRMRRIRRVFQSRTAGRLVLIDRWPQRSLARTFDGPRLQTVEGSARRLFSRISQMELRSLKLAEEFAPDVVFRFSVTPAVALSRKPGELTEDQAIQMAADLKRIQWPERTLVIDIDADGSIDAVDRSIRDAIWTTICGRR